MKTKIIIFIIALFVLTAIGYKMTGNIIKDQPTKVLLQTNMGDIVIELYPDKAPITVKNFLTYVNENAYDETVFHRVINDFMIQGGGFTPEGNQKPTHAPIKLESANDLKNEKYTIAMARTMMEDSATNQFFINTNNNEFLNNAPGNPGYTVFGKVVEGKEVVDKMSRVETKIKNNMKDWPVQDIIIEKAKTI